MKFHLKHWPWTRLAATGLAGVSLGCAFPLPGWYGLAWLSPAALLVSTLGLRGRSAFFAGWWGGFCFALVALRWLLNIPFPSGAIAGWISLSGYVGAYLGLWTWACQETLSRRGSSESESLEGGMSGTFSGHASVMMERPDLQRMDVNWGHEPSRLLSRPSATLPSIRDGGEGRGGEVRRFMESTWLRRAAWSLNCAVIWVAGELVISRFLTGFPWLFLGVTQYPLTPLAQLASLGGPYLISGLVVWCSVGVMGAGMALVAGWVPRRESELGRGLGDLGMGWGGRLGAGKFWLAELFLPGLALCCAFGWGMKRVGDFPKADRHVRTALIQPSIPQVLIWDRDEDVPRFNTVMELSRLAVAGKPELLLWPEAALPSFEESNYRAITRLASEGKIWMVFGADDVDRAMGEDGKAEDRYYNAAFLLDRSGRVQASYRKRRLVVFGEYVPFSEALPFLRWLTPIGTGFQAGLDPGFFEMSDLRLRASMSICFEDVFPHATRESLDEATDWIVNLTNNGWFGEGSAQWQHAVNASFRAIENGVPVVRATNNGLTCWIDPLGRIHEVEAGDAQSVYGPGFKMAEIGVWEQEKREGTFYRRNGDLFGWSCFAVVAVGGVFRLRCRRN